jgi:hypothetical protein
MSEHAEVRRDAGTDKPWVLVVESGTGQNRSALVAVRALANAGYRSAVTVSGTGSLASASRYCHRVVPTPPVDSPGFADAIALETASFPYLGVMPSSDAAIIALSAPGAQFVDKKLLAERAADVGLVMPSSSMYTTTQELLDAARDIDYPFVVKASRKTTPHHRPSRLINSPADLAYLRHAPGPHLVQQYVHGEVHSLNGVMWRGRLSVAVHQRHLAIWPPVCGDACLATTTAPPERLRGQVARLLEGYEGIFQAELIGDHLLDVNPRVYASVDLAIRAGVNLVGIHWDLFRGLPFEPVTPRNGVMFCWWEGEARRMVRMLRGGDTTALRTVPVITSRLFSEEIWDPKPVLIRLRYARRSRRLRSTGAPSRRDTFRSAGEISYHPPNDFSVSHVEASGRSGPA